MWIFLGVTTFMSVVYLYKTTPLGPVPTEVHNTPAVRTTGETIEVAITLVNMYHSRIKYPWQKESVSSMPAAPKV